MKNKGNATDFSHYRVFNTNTIIFLPKTQTFILTSKYELKFQQKLKIIQNNIYTYKICKFVLALQDCQKEQLYSGDYHALPWKLLYFIDFDIFQCCVLYSSEKKKK